MSLNLEGHLGLKSSPLATTSCKLTKQFLVRQNMNAHQKNMSNIKSSIDTTCPKSWYKHISVKDQIRREKSINNNRSRQSSAKSSNVNLHTLEDTILEQKYNDVYQSLNSESNTKEQSNDLLLNLPTVDLLDKNSKRFTNKKSFTPRILKNNKSSKLTQLPCYNPPKRKDKEKISEIDSMIQNDSILISEKINTPQQSLPVPKLSNLEIQLKELDLLKDLTDDILLKHNFTDIEFEQTCEYHIKKNKFGLNVDQMRKLCLFVKNNTKGMSQYASEFQKPYINEYEDIDESYLRSVESNIAEQVMFLEESAAPSRFQLSLRSNDELNSNQYSYYEDKAVVQSKSDSLEVQNEFDLDDIFERLNNVEVNYNKKLIEEKQMINSTLDEEDKIKNVHFSNQNELYSVQDTDRSLTDISPIQMENSEDSNMFTNIEMNKTFNTSYKCSDLDEYDDDFDN